MKDRARSDLTLEAWNALKGATWPIFNEIGKLTLDENSTPAQISLLNVLYDSPTGLTPAAVARALRVTPATVTGTLDRIEDAGLIERARGQNEDRRIVDLHITPKGRELVKRWREASRAHFEKIMAPLSDAELRALIALLARIGRPIAGVPEGLASVIQLDAKPKRTAKGGKSPKRRS